jgi:hypothetical protein
MMGGRILKHTNSMGYPCIGLWHLGKQKTVGIHVLLGRLFIANPLNKPQVEHRDLNKGNYALSNLRWSTRGLNGHNTLSRPGSSSQYKGVMKYGNKWIASATVNRKKHYLATCDTERDAALIFNIFATATYGEGEARLNIVPEPTEVGTEVGFT